MKVPDHVAAYAAALHTSGLGSWQEVRSFVGAAGMGHYDFRELADAALAWQRLHVAPSAVKAIRAAARAKKGPPGSAA